MRFLSMTGRNSITLLICFTLMFLMPILSFSQEEETESQGISKILRIWEEEKARYEFKTDGRYDPFLPTILKSDNVLDRVKTERFLTPLERTELSTIKLVAIVILKKGASALVEDSTGIGYVVKIGTSIGTNGGKITEIAKAETEIRNRLVEVITPAHIVVTERYKSYFDKMKTRTITIPLKGEEQ